MPKAGNFGRNAPLARCRHCERSLPKARRVLRPWLTSTIFRSTKSAGSQNGAHGEQPGQPVLQPDPPDDVCHQGAPLAGTQLVSHRSCKLLALLSAALLLWFCPHPDAISSKAWHVFVIFATTIASIILQPLPTGAVAAIAAAASMLTGSLSFANTFKAFSNEVPWLIAIAMFLADAITKSGLGRRIAYLAVRLLGAHPLGLAYALVISEAFLAPAIPSVAARSGGIILPLVRGLCHASGSRADDGTAKQLGSYLMVTCFQCAAVSSAMFLTANHPNPLSANLAESATGVALSWGLWAKAAIVPGGVALLAIPLVTYLLYTPLLKDSGNAQAVAQRELTAMGSLGRSEITVSAAMLVTVGLWIFGHAYGITSVAAALAGLSVLLLTEVITWEDCLKNGHAWDTMWWFAIIIGLASQLKELGVIAFIATDVSTGIASLGWGWHASSLALLLVYYYSHYFFASNIAHVSAMFSAFLACMIGAGAPPVLASLVLAFLSNVMGGLGTWTMSHAPMYFGEGCDPKLLFTVPQLPLCFRASLVTSQFTLTA